MIRCQPEQMNKDRQTGNSVEMKTGTLSLSKTGKMQDEK